MTKLIVERYTDGPDPLLRTAKPGDQLQEWYPGDDGRPHAWVAGEGVDPNSMRRTRGLGKPHGTWVSVPSDDRDDDWFSWCLHSDFVQGLGDHVHRFELDMSRVLHIDSTEALDRFHRERCLDPRTVEERARDFRGRARSKPSGVNDGDDALDALACFRIDWYAVAGEYAGIVIAPYQDARRHEYLWYYGWDCASGCIWDSSALRHIDTRPLAKVYARREGDE